MFLLFKQRTWMWTWRGWTTCWVTWSGAPAAWATQGTSEAACAAAVAMRATPAPACSTCRTLRRRLSSWAAAYKQHSSLTQHPPLSLSPLTTPWSRSDLTSPSCPSSSLFTRTDQVWGPSSSWASADFLSAHRLPFRLQHLQDIQPIISGQSLGCPPLCSAPIIRAGRQRHSTPPNHPYPHPTKKNTKTEHNFQPENVTTQCPTASFSMPQEPWEALMRFHPYFTHITSTRTYTHIHTQTAPSLPKVWCWHGAGLFLFIFLLLRPAHRSTVCAWYFALKIAFFVNKTITFFKHCPLAKPHPTLPLQPWQQCHQMNWVFEKHVSRQTLWTLN